jgi:hypothetical protein
MTKAQANKLVSAATTATCLAASSFEGRDPLSPILPTTCSNIFIELEVAIRVPMFTKKLAMAQLLRTKDASINSDNTVIQDIGGEIFYSLRKDGVLSSNFTNFFIFIDGEDPVKESIPSVVARRDKERGTAKKQSNRIRNPLSK